MALLSTNPSFFPRRLSMYVPAMQYASDANISGDTRISFGAPTLASATFFVNAQSVAAGATIATASILNSATALEPFGRNLTVVLSGAGTGTVIIDGYDYLGQSMAENLALNGATPVVGLKAFKYLRQITYPTVGAVTMNIGNGTRLGLPYKAGRALTEEFAGAVVGTVGTLNSPILTDPATATTGDPRGTFIATSTLDGASTLTATFEFYGDVNASNNGGLHGIAQYTN